VSEKCAVCGLTGHAPQEHVLPRVTVESLKAENAKLLDHNQHLLDTNLVWHLENAKLREERDRLRADVDALTAMVAREVARALLAPAEPARE
jgi:hypothetical protein